MPSIVARGLLAMAAAVVLPSLESALAAAAASSGDASSYGKVVTVRTDPKTQAVTRFTLTHGSGVIAFRVLSNTQFVPRSSAAAVQGFASGEFANVISRGRSTRAVEYDTTAFKPRPFEEISGAIFRVGKKGAFSTKDAAGKIYPVYRVSTTRFYMNGQPVRSFALRVNMTVRVLAEKSKPNRWIAVSIDQLTSSSSYTSAR